MIISNSCVGRFCYINKDYDILYQYNNPFIGCGLNADSWYKLLYNFNDIDFTNICLKSKFSDIYKKEINYLLVDDLIEFRFIHSNKENIINNWNRRCYRFLKYLNKYKYSWQERILFVSCSYRYDDTNYIKYIATQFPNLHQVINVFRFEKIYKNLKLSENTILFNTRERKQNKMINYIIENYFKYITDDYKNGYHTYLIS